MQETNITTNKTLKCEETMKEKLQTMIYSHLAPSQLMSLSSHFNPKLHVSLYQSFQTKHSSLLYLDSQYQGAIYKSREMSYS